MLGSTQGCLDDPRVDEAVRRGVRYLKDTQEANGSWYGRWGVNYVYGTWQTLVGLTRIGVPLTDARIRKASNWLKFVQQESKSLMMQLFNSKSE